jgi:hypothetical protein
LFILTTISIISVVQPITLKSNGLFLPLVEVMNNLTSYCILLLEGDLQNLLNSKI